MERVMWTNIVVSKINEQFIN